MFLIHGKVVVEHEKQQEKSLSSLEQNCLPVIRCKTK